MASELAVAYVSMLPEASKFVPEFNRQVGPGLARSGTEQGQKFGNGFTGSLGRLGQLVTRTGNDQGRQFGNAFATTSGKALVPGLSRQVGGLGALGREQGARYGTAFSSGINTGDASRKITTDLNRQSSALAKTGKGQGEQYGRAFSTEAVALIGAAPGIAGELSRRVGPEMEASGREQGQKFSSAFSSEASSGFTALAGAASAAAVNASEASDARDAEAAGEDAPGANDSFTGEIAGFAAGAAAIGFLTQSLEDVQNVERLGAQTASVIKSTGGAAQVSAEHVADLAESIEAMTSVEMEGTVEGANFLLTFKNIQNAAGDGNDIFDQTVQAMTDMSVAMGTDAKGSALQLGKALNDPVKGVSALSKVGITFSAEQKKQIGQFAEQNDLLSAQKIILGEVNSQFAGSADAFGETTAGGIAKAQNALGNFGEEIAGRVVPAIDTISSALLPVFDGLAGNTDTVLFVGAAFLAWKFIPPLLSQLGAGLGAATARVGAFATATTLAQTAAGRTTANVGRLSASMFVLSQQSGNVGRIGSAFVNASAGASRFATTAGLAAAAGRGLAIAGGGLLSALGGPFGVAVLAAGGALFFWMKKNQEAKAAAEANEQAISSLAETLDAQTGAITNNTIAAQSKKLAEGELIESARNYGIQAGDLVAAHLNQEGALERVNAVIEENIRKSTEASGVYSANAESYERAGVSLDDLTAALGGNSEKYAEVEGKIDSYNTRMSASGASESEKAASLDRLKSSLDDAGIGAVELGESVSTTNDQLSEAQRIQQDTALAMDQGSESASDMSEALDTLADSASTADDRTKALKKALDALNGNPLDLEQATSDLNAAFADTAESVKPTDEGVTPVVNVDTNSIDVATEAGRKFLDVTVAQQDATLNAARAARDAAIANGDLAGSQQAATAVVEQSRQKFIEQLGTLGVVGAEADKLADKYIGIPSVVSTLIDQPNMAESQLAMEILKNKVDLVPNDKNITVDTLDEDARQRLESLGFTVRDLPDGRVEVSANTVPAQDALNQLLEPKKLGVDIVVNNPGEVNRRLNEAVGAGIAVRGQTFADGGVREDHTAHIAPAGSWRVFGEPETGGEGYIPLAPAKRARSKTILRTIANRFGMRLDEYADGGIVEAMRGIVQKRWPGMELTSGQRNDGTSSFHNSGQAADFSNGSDSTPEMQALANFVADNYPDSAELIHSPFSRNIDNGSFVGDGMSTFGADTMAGHRNHVHWAMLNAPTEPAGAPTALDARSDREEIVDTIIGHGRLRGFNDREIKSGIMAGLAESDLQNLDYGDRDSQGVFQQRPSQGWGTVEQVRDIDYATNKYFDALQNVAGRENMTEAQMAQAVQRSAFSDGSNYAAREAEAQQLLDAAYARGSALDAANATKPSIDGLSTTEVSPESSLSSAGEASTTEAETFSIKDRLKQLGTDLVGAGVDAAFEQLPFGLGDSRWFDVQLPVPGSAKPGSTTNPATGVDGPQPDAKEEPPKAPATLAEALTALVRDGQFTGGFGVQESDPAIAATLGLRSLIKDGEFTGNLRNATGVEEDSQVAKGALGLQALMTRGDFTENFRHGFGVEESSPVVDWLRQISKGIPVFDQGGTLRPGINIVDNQTGANELLANITGMRAGDVAPADKGGFTLSIAKIEGANADEIVRKINMEFTRGMQRHAGRPF